MRLKAGVGDPAAADASISIDGVEIAYCIEASEEEGWADVLRVEPNGDVALPVDGKLPIDRLYGTVKITVYTAPHVRWTPPEAKESHA